MQVSIRTAYRIVKKTEDPESDPIFIPQYQEEGSEDWHTFKRPIHGRGGGANPVYCFSSQIAQAFIDLQKATQDIVVYYEDETGKWSKDSSDRV